MAIFYAAVFGPVVRGYVLRLANTLAHALSILQELPTSSECLEETIPLIIR
jgi:hypothetical protein